MEKQNHIVSIKQIWGRIIILLFCFAVTICVVSVLLFAYEPNQNTPGALGSACMDVISMIMLLILVLSLFFEKYQIGRTTKLCLALMLGTMWALFFDFLNWSLDGSLAYGGWTYYFTIASLCSGAMLAGIFVFYLSSYLYDMYKLNAFLSAKICLVCNIIAYILTVTLGLTKQAFVYVDGHYETGALYDVITVLPILTLLYFTGYIIFHVKSIGIHDVISVVVYIFMMIGGALIEAEYGVGATYVSVTLADIFIFVMLQNKLIDRAQEQKESLVEENSNQFEILESMAGIYSYVNYIDFDEQTAKRFDMKETVGEQLDIKNDPHTGLNKRLFVQIDEDMKEKFWAYTNLSTLSDRMCGEKIITAEFHHGTDGWLRANYIRIGDSLDSPIKRVIYAIRNIDEEKLNVEKWIQKSNTDEVTGFFNRHAYEDEIAALEEGEIDTDFVYVSMDVNGLKVVNDNLGHGAGDELIVGACSCMRQCFESYGKLYRTGGDEFVALIKANDAELTTILKNFSKVTSDWRGELIDNLTISCGYVAYREVENMSLHQIAVLADKRMYESKRRYYQNKGVDRRGQRDAHVALCDLYTKILKINLTGDSYQIVNMDAKEQTKDKGFSEKISVWMFDFALSGQVHPDDREEYISKTNVDYISRCFKNSREPLRIFYRRKSDDTFRRVMMEIVPANDYSDEDQNLFLYVKDIEQ